MPILKGRSLSASESMSETASAPTYGREGIDDDRIAREEGDGMADARAQPAQPRAGHLQLDVAPRAGLRRVRLHRRLPCRDGLRGGDVDENRRQVAGLRFERAGVEKELVDGVRRRIAQ